MVGIGAAATEMVARWTGSPLFQHAHQALTQVQAQASRNTRAVGVLWR